MQTKYRAAATPKLRQPVLSPTQGTREEMSALLPTALAAMELLQIIKACSNAGGNTGPTGKAQAQYVPKQYNYYLAGL